MTGTERFWLLDYDADAHAKDLEATMERGGLTCLVDEEAGGIIAYVISQHAGLIPVALEARYGQASDDERTGPDEHDACPIHEEAHRICGCPVPSSERLALRALVRWLGETGDIRLPVHLHAQVREALGEDFYRPVTR